MSVFAGTTVDVPAGVILPWTDRGTNAPPGWVYCDGNNGTPDLRRKFVTGYRAQEPQIGSTGGQHNVSLSESELPSHSHTLTTTTDNAHSHELGHGDSTINLSGSGAAVDEWTDTSDNEGSAETDDDGAHQHTFQVDSEGNGATGAQFSNKPRRVNVSFIQKV